MKKRAELMDNKGDVLDTLYNLVANIGTSKDKRRNSEFKDLVNLTNDVHQLNALYRTNWLCGKVVDIVPEDMTREWRSFNSDLDPKVIKQLVNEENRLDLTSNFDLAHKWSRLYGTAFIIMSIDDGGTPDKPLNLNKIKKGSLRHIKVVDRHQINHAETVIVRDPLNPNYGLPEFYRINETSTRIHSSRVIRFDGVKLPYYEFQKNNYCSDSVLARLFDSVLNFNIATDNSASMIFEANVDIVKIKGLMDYLQSQEGTDAVTKRVSLMKSLKAFNNTTILDVEEDIQTKTNTFSGLHELIDKYGLILAAASDIPATRLLGSSASGLNATGEGDLKNYYNKIAAYQIRDYKPKLDYFDKIMALNLGITDVDDLSYEFNSLFQLSDLEQSQLDLNNAQRDSIYFDRGVVDEVVVAKELNQKGTYSNLTDEFMTALEESLNFESNANG